MDSVKEGKTGLLFHIHEGLEGQSYDKDATREAAQAVFRKAIALYGDKDRVREMRLNAMNEDHSWSNRIQKHFRSLFEYVLNHGPERLVHAQGARIQILPPEELLKGAGLVMFLCARAIQLFKAINISIHLRAAESFYQFRQRPGSFCRSFWPCWWMWGWQSLYPLQGFRKCGPCKRSTALADFGTQTEFFVEALAQ